MKRRFVLGALAALSVSAAACTSSGSGGNKFNFDNINQLVPGKTTLSEAKAVLGAEPISFRTTADGHRVYTWSYTHAQGGVFVGHGASVRAVGVEFDKASLMVGIVGQRVVDVGR